MLFSEWALPNLRARNRLVRSATYEGLADEEGRPLPALAGLYRTLAHNDVGTIITGFCYVSPEGMAMQRRQCGMDADDKIAPWEAVVSPLKRANPATLFVMQIAHAGRQTLSRVSGRPALAPSTGRSLYFKEKPVVMGEREIEAAVRSFREAALRAQQAGFDGVQLHAAHGYLIHQFLSPATNVRRDRWGEDRLLFLVETLRTVKDACGPRFPVFLKVSGGDELRERLRPALVGEYLARLESLGVEAAEVSHGTMDLPFNIFRGEVPIEAVFAHNILFKDYPRVVKRLWKRFVFPSWQKRFFPFAENYNLGTLKEIRRRTKLPLILVGGIRSQEAIEEILAGGEADAIALCRPLIREPDLGARFRSGESNRSTCTNCNLCAVMCDSLAPLRCYRGGTEHDRPA